MAKPKRRTPAKRKNSAPKTAVGRPFQKGPDPRRGHGVKGRSGRLPTAIVEAAQTIADRHELLDVAAAIAVGDIWEEWETREGERVSGPTKNSDRLAAIKLIFAYAYGTPTQHVEHTGKDGGPITQAVEVRQLKESLTAELDRMAEQRARLN